MWRLLLPILATLLLPALEGSAWAQLRSGLIPPPLARRYGLERSWYAQVELDAAQARVAHITQHVSTSFGLTIIDVVMEGNEAQKLATITDRDLDVFGNPLGPEGAKKAADQKIADLQAIGVAAKAITHVVPEITLYVTTDNGFLHAINGETGATRWVIPVGRPEHPTFAAAANDYYVAAINGVYLYVFEALDGRLAWRKRLTHAAGAGPAVSQQFVHVPMVTGAMESYFLPDPDAPLRVYQSFGRVLLQPTTTPTSLIWATDRGFLYVGNADRPGVRFRLETQDEIVARPTWLAPNRVVGVSLDGDVYLIDEFTGNIVWRFSTGDPIGHSPIAVGDDVYAITNNYVMFRLSAKTGGSGVGAMWSTPGVTSFLAASKDRLYCRDRIGRLAILDRRTGGRIATLPGNLTDIEVLNHQTDRLFLATSSGLIQCFHEQHLEYPIIHQGPGTEAPAAQPQPQPAAPAAAPPMGEPADANPFGGAPDPFGGEAAPAPADPFGGGGAAPADPFGAGGAAAPKQPAAAEPAAEDPFGADPFGAP